jgi:hypothetical protein
MDIYKYITKEGKYTKNKCRVEKRIEREKVNKN